MIYLLKDGDFLKIGYTSKIVARMKQYRTHSNTVEFLAYKEGELEDEVNLHRMCEKFLIRTEWFKYDQAVIDIFNNYICIEKTPKPEPIIGEFVTLREIDLHEHIPNMEDIEYYKFFQNVLKLEDLSGNEKIILTIILSYYSNGQQFNMSNNTLAMEAGMDYSSVVRCINSLKEKGYLKTYRVMHKNSNKIAGRVATPQKEFLLAESGRVFDVYEYEEY